MYIVKILLYVSYFINNMMMKFNDKNYIAEKIKYHRKKQNLTQAELAEMVNLSDQHLSRIESGCYIPSLPTFFTIIETLKIDLREFGYNIETTENNVKNELIDIIAKSNSNELIFYNKIIKSIKESFYNLKDNI